MFKYILESRKDIFRERRHCNHRRSHYKKKLVRYKVQVGPVVRLSFFLSQLSVILFSYFTLDSGLL